MISCFETLLSTSICALRFGVTDALYLVGESSKSKQQAKRDADSKGKGRTRGGRGGGGGSAEGVAAVKLGGAVQVLVAPRLNRRLFAALKPET